MDIIRKAIKITYFSNWVFFLASTIYVYHSTFFDKGGYGLGAIAVLVFYIVPSFYVIVQPVFYYWAKHFINNALNLGFLIIALLSNILADITTISLIL